jgi:small subunit ribosomal protein S16
MVHNQLILLFFLTKALLKHHLDGGIRKALTQEQADAKLAAWLEAKTVQLIRKNKAQADVKAKASKQREVNAKRLAAAQAELMLSLLRPCC